MMNPSLPRIFGSGQFDPSQLPQNMFTQDDMEDHNDHNDQGDPKRRRIARVHAYNLEDDVIVLTAFRHAICAGRRRLSVTAKCPPVHTAKTTRQNVSLHR